MKRIVPGLVACYFLLVSLHVANFAIYTTHHRIDVKKRYRDTLVQEVMNILHMVQATPETQLKGAIDSLDKRRVTVTFTEKPAFKKHVTNLSYWYINQLIDEEPKTLTLSLLLPDNQWVNIKANFYVEYINWPHIFMFLSEISIGFIVLFYAWSINRYIRPLRKYQRAAELLGVDVTTTKLEEYKGPKIVRETSQALNDMQLRIQELIHDRTLMLAAISHDLRTPITRLKLRAHLFGNDELTEKTLSDLDNMETMIKEILQFSKNENEDEKKRNLDLNSLLQTICNELSDLNSDITYHVDKTRYPLLIRESQLRRALTNLIQNAVKYGNKAIVTLTKKDSQYIITIDDEGPGIVDSEKEKVFRPFYRLDHSRSRKIAGTGLGLAIAKSAIIAHRGKITLKNRSNKGLRVTITLPLG